MPASKFAAAMRWVETRTLGPVIGRIVNIPADAEVIGIDPDLDKAAHVKAVANGFVGDSQ